MKWLSAAMQPGNFCTSFKAVGEFILNMSLSFSGLASMPRYDTMKPSSFPEGTPKTLWRMLPRDIHIEAQFTHSDRGWAGPTNSRQTTSGLLATQDYMKLLSA